MNNHKVTILVAPALQNSSCTHSRYADVSFFLSLSFGSVLQAFIVLMLTVGVLTANIMLIIVINSRRYSKYIHSQPRYLLTSLASNDLAMGLLVTPFAIVPSLRHCWPYGEVICQIQALLRGAISQQSAVILICMAMDRYICMLHPARYHKHSSKKVAARFNQCWVDISKQFRRLLVARRLGCVAIISMTWIMSVTLFSILVLPRGGYYFNPTGMMACEPFYTQASIRILAACGFYFPTTMILMYCYGSAFHVNKLRLRKSGCNTIASPDDNYGAASIEKLVTQERRLSTTASRTMAAMSLGFIVLVTPWTIQEVVAACTGSRAPPPLDFLATWLALSNSFWNPFLYWLLNNHFRRISREFLYTRLLCRKPKESKAHHRHHYHHEQHHQQQQQQQQQHHQQVQHYCSNSSSGVLTHSQGCDFDGLSEKYWGEILERTLSSSSLHALQRAYSQPRIMERCNGIQEMKVFDTAVPDL